MPPPDTSTSDASSLLQDGEIVSYRRIVASWNAIFLLEITRGESERCLAVYCSDGLAVLREKDGEELFFQEWKEGRARVNAMTPVVVGNKIFVSSGYEKGCCVIEIGKAGSKIVWESKVMRSHMTGPVFYEGHLYGFDDAILKCLDLDGKEIWRERGLGKGALVMADGKLILNSSDGELIVVEASSEGYRELSRTTVLDGGVYWTSPVLANGRIYCRNSFGDIVCRDHRAED